MHIVNLFLMLINRLLMLSRGSLMKHTSFTAARDKSSFSKYDAGVTRI